MENKELETANTETVMNTETSNEQIDSNKTSTKEYDLSVFNSTEEAEEFKKLDDFSKEIIYEFVTSASFSVELKKVVFRKLLNTVRTKISWKGYNEAMALIALDGELENNMKNFELLDGETDKAVAYFSPHSIEGIRLFLLNLSGKTARSAFSYLSILTAARSILHKYSIVNSFYEKISENDKKS